jgi:hypothetical protein
MVFGALFLLGLLASLRCLLYIRSYVYVYVPMKLIESVIIIIIIY